MKKNISIPNPFAMLTDMKPFVKCVLIVSLALIIVASMYFGYFDDILNLFSGKDLKS